MAQNKPDGWSGNVPLAIAIADVVSSRRPGSAVVRTNGWWAAPAELPGNLDRSWQDNADSAVLLSGQGSLTAFAYVESVREYNRPTGERR